MILFRPLKMPGYAITLLAFISFLLFFVGSTSYGMKEKPDIILIYVDDMGYGDPGCYGGDWVKTPNIDKLAGTGIRFTKGYSASPVCGPARYGILTGAYPSRFGVYWNKDAVRTIVPDEHPLLPQLLRTAGYTTGVVGKWNITNDVHANADEVYDMMYWSAQYWPRPDNSYVGVDGGWGAADMGLEEAPSWGPIRDGDEYLTDRLTQHAVNFIRNHKDSPSFLYLAYNGPHSPLQAHRKFKDRVAHLPTEPERLYAAMLLSVDEGVGRILETLEELGLRESTFIAFTSDNGPAYGKFRGYKKEWPPKLLGSAGPLRGRKGAMYEGGIRVPFILSWPAVLPEGVVDNRMVSALDLYPTFAAVAGAKIPDVATIDGVDLMPYLLDDKSAVIHDSIFITRKSNGKDGSVIIGGAFVKGDWKLTLQGNEPALYNLKEDIGESVNLYSVNIEKRKELEAEYNELLSAMPEKGYLNDPSYKRPPVYPSLSRVLTQTSE